MAACLFALYFVGSRCGLQSRIIYTLLCPCLSALSMTKILHLEILRSNLALNAKFYLRLASRALLMSFVFAPAATYLVSLYRNIKNHLTILRLDVLRSNLALNFISRLVFSRHTSLRFPCGRNCKQKAAHSGSVTDERVYSLASFTAASSDEKILRLEILHLNLKSNF